MVGLYYRLSENRDPEERLEDAAMWKALHDEYGDEIEAIVFGDERDGVIFGRGRQYRGRTSGQPLSEYLPYWTDPAFLEAAGREFHIAPYGKVQAIVSSLHAVGKGAFIKSTRPKHAIIRIPVGRTVDQEFGDLAFSFIDGGPELMVQEECTIEYEHRFFVIDRKIVTHSPIQWALTPLDYPLPPGTVYRTPQDTAPETCLRIVSDLEGVAVAIAAKMRIPHASVDCALIDGKAGAIEFNPMQIGQLGLYACDVRALASASRLLIPT